MAQTIARWIVALVGFFILFFAMGLMFLLLVPLGFERAMGAGPSLPLGLWSQVRFAPIIGGMFSCLSVFGLLAKRLEARLDARAPAPRRRQRARR
jgi:hypothetical protein